MKRFIFSGIFGLMLCLHTFAGDNKKEVLTLSKGKYVETFDQDSIEVIGNILYNVNSRRIVGFIDQEQEETETVMEPEIISRWLSIDPLAANYPSISPYAFVANNPIRYIDPDGRLILDYSAAQLKDMGLTQAQVTRFENVVNNVYNLVRDNPQVMTAISNTTGFSSDRIASELQPGNGPTVSILPYGPGARGGRDGIVIDPSLVKNLAGISGADKAQLSEQTLGMALTILHEYGHYGDQVTNDGNNSGQYFPESYTNASGGITTKPRFDSELFGGNNIREGKQNWKISLTGHRGTDIEVMGFGTNFSVDANGKHIKDPAKLAPTINSNGLTIPSLPENAKDENILKTLNVR